MRRQAEFQPRPTARWNCACGRSRHPARRLSRSSDRWRCSDDTSSSNRFGVRDVSRGGDDWALPSTIEVIEHFSNRITVNDFSNMNGGSFAPDHVTHRNGTDVDGWFDGYNARNAVTAQTMIDLLNDDAHGSDIGTVYVTYQRVITDPFWNAIRNVTLDDGRAASDVILPLVGHTTHFHWIIDA